MQHQALCIIWNPSINSGKNCRLFVLRYLEIWWMALKNNRTPLLYYIKLCAVFQSHWYIQIGVTVRKPSIWVKIGDFFCPVWPYKLTNDLEKIRHLVYTTSSFVHHLKSICEVKLEIQSGNDQFGSKLAMFGPAWPGNLMDDHEKQYGTTSMLH